MRLGHRCPWPALIEWCVFILCKSQSLSLLSLFWKGQRSGGTSSKECQAVFLSSGKLNISQILKLLLTSEDHLIISIVTYLYLEVNIIIPYCLRGLAIWKLILHHIIVEKWYLLILEELEGRGRVQVIFCVILWVIIGAIVLIWHLEFLLAVCLTRRWRFKKVWCRYIIFCWLLSLRVCQINKRPFTKFVRLYRHSWTFVAKDTEHSLGIYHLTKNTNRS